MLSWNCVDTIAIVVLPLAMHAGQEGSGMHAGSLLRDSTVRSVNVE